MHQLVYVSSAVRKPGHEDIAAILNASRRNNRRLGVSGMLLHIGGKFLQVLEGERSNVHEIFGQVLLNPRHEQIDILADERSFGRNFGQWSMAFLEPSRMLAPDVYDIARQAMAGKVHPANAANLPMLIKTFYRANAGEIAA